MASLIALGLGVPMDIYGEVRVQKGKKYLKEFAEDNAANLDLQKIAEDVTGKTGAKALNSAAWTAIQKEIDDAAAKEGIQKGSDAYNKVAAKMLQASFGVYNTGFGAISLLGGIPLTFGGGIGLICNPL